MAVSQALRLTWQRPPSMLNCVAFSNVVVFVAVATSEAGVDEVPLDSMSPAVGHGVAGHVFDEVWAAVGVGIVGLMLVVEACLLGCDGAEAFGIGLGEEGL
ncbi:unknown protein [Seminavis robusta]|uniref:Uncharacterized protein n=1 Tax=Seminavis robusta TaxID=568900 RepID=A0A9N8HGN0_9STRA|nr:unknown protein [Seminavis robusta]|eukprot:Sro517_g158710.1 n/a (101) ;mRNA; r:42632-42934